MRPQTGNLQTSPNFGEQTISDRSGAYPVLQVRALTTIRLLQLPALRSDHECQTIAEGSWIWTGNNEEDGRGCRKSQSMMGWSIQGHGRVHRSLRPLPSVRGLSPAPRPHVPATSADVPREFPLASVLWSPPFLWMNILFPGFVPMPRTRRFDGRWRRGAGVGCVSAGVTREAPLGWRVAGVFFRAAGARGGSMRESLKTTAGRVGGIRAGGIRGGCCRSGCFVTDFGMKYWWTSLDDFHPFTNVAAVTNELITFFTIKQWNALQLTLQRHKVFCTFLIFENYFHLIIYIFFWKTLFGYCSGYQNEANFFEIPLKIG